MRGLIAGFIKKEFAQSLRDPVMKLFLLAAPVMQMLLFGYAIDTNIKNIRLAFIYRGSDAAAAELSGRIFSGPWFLPAGRAGDDPNFILESNRADAVLITGPRSLDRQIKENDIKLQLLVNAENAIKARAVDAYVNAILAGYIKDKYGAAGERPGINFNIRVLYNPSMATPLFMIPALMALIMCLATVLLTGMSIAREKEMGTFESIIAAPVGRLEIILGKTVPYVIIGLVDGMFIILTGMLIFGVPLRGSLPLLALATFIFVCTTVSIGTLISTFAANQQQAMMGAFLFLFSANLLSGMMFPIENMPLPVRTIAYLNPLKYYISIMRNIMLKGNIPGLYWPELGILTLMMTGVIIISERRFRRTLN